MGINEFNRRSLLVHWRMKVLGERYLATDDPLKRAMINIDMGRELNSIDVTAARRAFGL